MTGGLLATLLLLLVPASRAIAEPLAIFRGSAVCPEMVALPLGVFTMGAPDDEFRRNLVFDGTAIVRSTPDAPYAKADEGPQVRVMVDIPIAMGVNEVTYASSTPSGMEKKDTLVVLTAPRPVSTYPMPKILYDTLKQQANL